MGRFAWVVLVLAACGGAEPYVPAEPIDRVSLLVRDPGLSAFDCAARAELDFTAKLEISGVLGDCNVHLKEDGSALSLCDEVPGKAPRDVVLTYLYAQKQSELELVTVTTAIDLTMETRDTVELDFTEAERHAPDVDGDGVPSLDELCVGRNPRDPNG